MAVTSDDAPATLRAYYQILTGGIDTYEDGRALAPLLADDLEFEGPIAGRVTGSAPFLQGVKGFIANVGRIDLVHEVHGPDGSAVLYDAHLPKGVVRLAEFFTYADGRIRGLRVQYDPAAYLAGGGA
ncbi:nuclear transport factor 2 family protein [Nonomuraea longicatena]|uniref:SnoaL-like domain-containing protein n=1 Tax=Nonomuraea longicatena TaxID=83682 RepID=A0ABP4A220_9ACTN